MEPELWAGDERRGEGDEEQSSSGVSTWPSAATAMAPSWECQCHGQRDTELCCDGVLEHCRDGNQQTRSWELPVTEKTTVTFTFPAKSSSSCRWAGSARLCHECGHGTGMGLAWPWSQLGTRIFLTAKEATADPRHNLGTG